MVAQNEGRQTPAIQAISSNVKITIFISDQQNFDASRGPKYLGTRVNIRAHRSLDGNP